MKQKGTFWEPDAQVTVEEANWLVLVSSATVRGECSVERWERDRWMEEHMVAG